MSTTKITKSLRQKAKPIIEETQKIYKDREIDEILCSVKFLTPLCDHEFRTLDICFGQGQKEFFIISDSVGLKSGYKISISIAEFFDSVLRDVEEKEIAVICKVIDNSLYVKFANNSQLKQFVDIIFNVIKVIVEAELTLLECKEAIRGFNRDKCSKRFEKINSGLEDYLNQRIVVSYYEKHEEIIKKYMNNIKQVKSIAKNLGEKRDEIESILLRAPSNNEEIFLVERYQASIFKAERMLNELARQYQALENNHCRFLKIVQEDNYTTIGELMTEQQASIHMGKG